MINIATLNGGNMSIVTGTPGPEGHPETRITFSDGSSDTYEWSGEIDKNTMVDAGLYDDSEYTWIKEPETVDIGNTVTSVGASAFEGCSGLESVTIPDSVTSIGVNAFCDCIALTNVTIPDSVTSIGEGAFFGCSGLADANGFVIIRNVLYGYFGDGWDVTIPNSVTSIGASAFYGCSLLDSVTIPDSVISIEEQAFFNCNSLTNVTIPNSVTSIGSDAFNYCTNLTSITIGDGVTSIGYWAFYECSRLTSVTFLGKTLEQVQNIEDENGDKCYPWGISDTSIIHVA